MIDTLKALCTLNGVSGNEAEVRNYIVDRVSKSADTVTTDVMGNVIVFKRGAVTPKKKVVLCAHMDEVGLIVRGITDDGYIKFGLAGSMDVRIIVGKPVCIGEKRIFGIIGCKAIHLVKQKDRDKTISIDEMYIDIGAKNKEDAEKLVSLGDTCMFVDDFREFGDGFIKSKAIDDRFGCSVLINLIESELPIDCWFAFTVQEEVGLRGASTAAYRINPDIALIIEATTGADLPSVDEHKKVCRTGSGAVIPFMDGATIYSRELYGILTNIAGRDGIPWQTKNVISSGTDAAAFQRSRAGVMTAGIAAPVRNLHSPSCVGKVTDLEAVYELANKFLDECAATES